MRQILNQFLLFLLVVLIMLSFLLLVSCERRPLEEETIDKAIIPITIDWVTLAHMDPDHDAENLYRASVWFFSKDGAVFNGKRYKEFRLDDPKGGTVELPIGHYSVLIFNNSIDEFSDNVGFRGTDQYDTFEYYAQPASTLARNRAGLENPVKEPDLLAAWRRFEYEVTPQMVRESRSLTSPMSDAERKKAREDLRKLLGLQPERLTYTVHTSARLLYLKSLARPAEAVLVGMAHSVKLASKEVSLTPSSFAFEMNNRKFDSSTSKHGRIEAYFRSLGMLASAGAVYELRLRFTLTQAYEGSATYPPSTQEPFGFDVTSLLRSQPAPHADYCVHLDAGIELPDLVSGSFDADVDDWGDEDNTEIPIR